MSIPYIGDFAEDATVYHYFNTFSSNDPAASITITDLADADLFVYKDGSVTDIVTDGATVVIDFDSRTGIHKITIDTSAHADYAVGSDYMVSMVGTTVDVGTITAALFTFSIENRYNAAADDLANGTDGLGAIKAETALILADTGTTLQAELDAIQAAVITNAAGADIAADIIAAKADTAAILVDTADMQPKLGTPAADVSADIAAVKVDTAATLVDTSTTLQAELDGIQADTEDIQTQIGTAGAGLTAVAWNAAWDAEVESEVNDALDTAISELGVAAPTATPTIRTGLMLLYMALRNKTVVQTSGTDAIELYNNAGTKIAAKLITDDGSDYTEAEMA